MGRRRIERTPEQEAERKSLNNARSRAVRHAWKEEKELVLQGKGTRNWTEEQQEELVTTGKVKGFEGHHMKSAAVYPEYAGDAKNIQFLSANEHYYGAHDGNTHSLTNGYYDPEAHTIREFEGDELMETPVRELSVPVYVETEHEDYPDGREETVKDEDYIGDLTETETETEDYTGDLTETEDESEDYIGDLGETESESEAEGMANGASEDMDEGME